MTNHHITGDWPHGRSPLPEPDASKIRPVQQDDHLPSKIPVVWLSRHIAPKGDPWDRRPGESLRSMLVRLFPPWRIRNGHMLSAAEVEVDGIKGAIVWLTWTQDPVDSNPRLNIAATALYKRSSAPRGTSGGIVGAAAFVVFAAGLTRDAFWINWTAEEQDPTEANHG